MPSARTVTSGGRQRRVGHRHHITMIPQLDMAAGGLEYVEQPCRTIDELAIVRRKVAVRIAADEAIRRAEDPLRVAWWRERLCRVCTG
jgi:hypothetical protein